MAASTLPLTFSKLQRNTPTGDYDEHGARIARPTEAGNDWDEEVVPALRRRLEEESVRLDKRISRMDEHTMHFQSRQNSKPVPRYDGNDEIIQDGLGSDDLIPSEWATGSKAQFARLAPKLRSNADDGARTISDSYDAYNAPNYLSRSHIPQQTLGHTSPTPSGSSPTFFSAESPSPIGDEGYQSVPKAREKARRLARERERFAMQEPGVEQYAENDVDRANTNWPEEAFGGEKHRGAVAKERARTLSTPGAYNPGEAAKRAKHSVKAASPSESRLRNSGSKGSFRDDKSPPSKIPLPTSGSMSKYQDQYVSQAEMRRSKSAALLTHSAVTPPHQDGVDDPLVLRQSSHSASKVRRHEPRKTLARLENSPPTQDVLDEFGPLGGTPKANRGPGRTLGEGDAQKGRRSVSNPWDEEMLPTVKKRLEQQMILDNMSHDDGFVDTWDRNGLPLTKSQVILKQRAREERARAKDAVGEQGNAEDAHSLERKPLDQKQESAERMRRLQEQLDMGIRSATAAPSSTTAQIEMQERPFQSPRTAPLVPVADKKARPNGAQNPAEGREDDAGCCKCTVM